MAKPVDSDVDVLNIATIATGSESMGRTIASCFKRVGQNGATMVEDGQTLMDEIDFTEGMEIERGFISPYFVKNQEAQTCEMETPRILVTDRKIGNMNELVPILEGLVQSKDPLLIIAVYADDDPRTPTRDPATRKRTRGTGTTALARRGRRYARAAARLAAGRRDWRSALVARTEQDARRARHLRDQVARLRRSAARLPRGHRHAHRRHLRHRTARALARGHDGEHARQGGAREREQGAHDDDRDGAAHT